MALTRVGPNPDDAPHGRGLWGADIHISNEGTVEEATLQRRHPLFPLLFLVNFSLALLKTLLLS